MSEYTFNTEYQGFDFSVTCEVTFGRDYQDGDFELEITEIYMDVAKKNVMYGINVFDNIDGDVLEDMADKIRAEADLSSLAYSELCDEADYRRDQKKDCGI